MLEIACIEATKAYVYNAMKQTSQRGEEAKEIKVVIRTKRDLWPSVLLGRCLDVIGGIVSVDF
jgi:hypothetical protein